MAGRAADRLHVRSTDHGAGLVLHDTSDGACGDLCQAHSWKHEAQHARGNEEFHTGTWAVLIEVAAHDTLSDRRSCRPPPAGQTRCGPAVHETRPARAARDWLERSFDRVEIDRLVPRPGQATISRRSTAASPAQNAAIRPRVDSACRNTFRGPHCGLIRCRGA